MKFLEEHGVFFSNPLDLDFSMLQLFPEAYGLEADDRQPPTSADIKSVLGKKGDAAAMTRRRSASSALTTSGSSSAASRPSTSPHWLSLTTRHSVPRCPSRSAGSSSWSTRATRNPRVIAPEAWLPAADMTLEPNALTAVTMTERSLVVTAGPGAGKTELLAQRADFLLRTGQCRYPRRILAISFKVDAAKNLKDRVRRRCSPELAARLDSYTFHAFAKRLIDTFRPVLTGIDALDPDYAIGRDRIPDARSTSTPWHLWRRRSSRSSPFARAALRQTYGFVFLDEFQDCTTNQYMLLHAAFHGTDVGLSAVGDVKQRIMGWAGALEGVLGRFAEDFEAQPLTLYLNFRAQPRLRRMQNAMVRVMEPSAAVPDVDLAGDGGEIEVLRYRDSAVEARELADRIAAWITIDDVPGEEIAIWSVLRSAPTPRRCARSCAREMCRFGKRRSCKTCRPSRPPRSSSTSSLW